MERTVLASWHHAHVKKNPPVRKNICANTLQKMSFKTFQISLNTQFQCCPNGLQYTLEIKIHQKVSSGP